MFYERRWRPYLSGPSGRRRRPTHDVVWHRRERMTPFKPYIRRSKTGAMGLRKSAEHTPPAAGMDDRLFSTLLRHSFDGIVLNDRESRVILKVSDSFCELTGYGREELI